VTAADASHELYEQLAVGHALSALEPEDEQAFLAHLPGCAACERALAEHTETLAHLAYEVEAAEPPPGLLDGIRAGVAASGRSGDFPAPAPVSLDAVREQRRHRTVRFTTALLGAAAALVMVVGLVIVNQGLQDRNKDTQAADAQLAAAVSRLLTPGAKKVDLLGSGGEHAVAVVDRNGRLSLVLDGLDPNDADRSTYVLWERSELGAVKAVGTFDVSSEDVAVVDGLHLAGDVGALDRLMVTQEQGRSAPPLAQGDLVVAGDA
jgi:anti-sigma factor RsiW